MKKFLVAAVTASLFALNLQAAPSASASSGCDSHEILVVNAIKTATLLSTITTAASNWRSCLSGYADSWNSYSSYFYTAGGDYYSIMTSALTYSQSRRDWGLKAAADYRMALLGEESQVNTKTGITDCDSTYEWVTSVALTAGDIALGSKAAGALRSCKNIRLYPLAKVGFSYPGNLGVGTTIKGISGDWPYNVSVGYQWYRGNSAIPGATAADYVVQQSDVGYQLQLKVTGSRSGLISVSRYTDYTEVVSLPMTLTPTPGVSGTHRVGNVLTVSPGTWDSGVTLSYRWLRNGEPIDLATSPTYTLTNLDVNKSISVRVVGIKTGYFTVAKTSSATTVTGLDLTSTPIPTFTGTKKLGNVLTATPNTWDSGVTLSYQWLRDGNAISGATGSTYTLVAEDVGTNISVTVTGTKLGYTTVSRTSTSSAIEAAEFTGITLKPWLAVFGGDAAVGRTSQAAIFVHQQGADYSYRWFKDGALITGLTSENYTFTPQDFDSVFTVEVTVTKLGYKTLVGTTDPVRVGGAMQTLTPTPTISGLAKVGQTLTAVPGTWASGIELNYRWLRGGVAIDGATSNTYTLVGADGLGNISVEVTGSGRGYNTVSKVSSSVSVAQGTISSSTVPAIIEQVRVGRKISCSPNSSLWDPGVTFSYNWLRDGVSIGAPDSETYTVTHADLSRVISCSVTGSKPGYVAQTKTSAGKTALIGQFDGIATSTGEFKAGSTVTIDRGQWPDNATISVQWWTSKGGERAIPGATGLSYKITAAEAGFILWAVIEVSAPGFESATRANGKAVYRPGIAVAQLGDSNPPILTGEKRVGSPITISPGTWDPGTETTLTLRRWDPAVGTWEDSTIARASCVGSSACVWSGPMVNSTGQFVPDTSVLGRSLLLTVDGTFEGVAGSAVTYLQISKGTFKPALLPKLSGDLRQGSTVSVDFSSFDPSATITYQWGWEVISPNFGSVFARQLDATGSSYLLGRAGKVALEVVISRPGFETLTYLYPYQTVLLPEQTNISKPVITGLNRVGSNLGVNFGTGAIGTSLKSIIWYRNGVKIAEGVKNLTSKVSELGAEITVSAVLSRAGFEDALVTSAAITMLPGIMGAGTPSITGTPRVGATLTASTSSWVKGAVISYQWLLDGKAIRGATARTYKLLSTQKGKRISLTITQTAPGYVTATKTSAAIKVG